MLINDIVNTLYKERVSILPVVDERKKLVGIMTRKSVINQSRKSGSGRMSISGNGLRSDATGEQRAGGRVCKPALNV
jgi:CBS-domain-containing membrane protein